MQEPQEESITPNAALESTEHAEPLATYVGSGRALDYALAKAVDDALALPDRERPGGDTRPVRESGERLQVVRWEVVLGNGHVPDHIIWLR
jgi:glyoxylase-like metal-dependent hydrolase (beta-lactamase superfamily II)